MTRRSDGVALRIADYVKKQSVLLCDYVKNEAFMRRIM